jgi:hypothetical protein
MISNKNKLAKIGEYEGDELLEEEEVVEDGEELTL